MADPKAPYLHVAAFWCATDQVDAVAEAVGPDVFPRPEGFRGAVVSFRFTEADLASFRHVMHRLDLAEVNERPHG